MRQIKLIITSLLLLSTFTLVLAGGGWTKKKKRMFIKLNQFALFGDRYYNPEGSVIDIRPGIALYSTSIYAEYGITDRLTGIVYLPFFSRSIKNKLVTLHDEVLPGDELNSLGDTDISLKYGIIQNKPIVLSASLTLGLPLGVSAGGSTNSLSTGDGEFNQMISLEASHSFYPLNLYVSTLVSLNNRTKNLSDEFRYGLEVGYTYKSLIGIVRLYGVDSFMNGDEVIDPVQGIFSNNLEYTSIAYEAAYNLSKKVGLSGSIVTAISGKRVLANPSYSFGIYMNL